MDTMINLSDLFKHEIMDLYSAEEQIIEALPTMIESAKNPQLKKALQEHLKVTREQKNRLDIIKRSLGEESNEEKKSIFTRLFGSGSEKCKGMEGLITEGEKIMSADITPEALDAAIIASCQKIEHYEICGYGTARAFARELNLAAEEKLLTQTLNEEYTADNLLTVLAVGKLNLVAEQATEGDLEDDTASRVSSSSNSSKKPAAKKSVAKKAAAKKSVTKKQVPKKAVVKKTAPKKAAPKKVVSKKVVPKKAAAKKVAPKKAAPKKAAAKKRTSKTSKRR